MHSFLKSFTYAAAGITFCFRQRNFKIQLVATVIVLVLSAWIHLSRQDFVIVILICLLVLILEMVNTALEHLCNLYSTGQNPEIKIIKDVAAGAVMVAAIGSLIAGIIIFTPYFILKINL